MVAAIILWSLGNSFHRIWLLRSGLSRANARPALVHVAHLSFFYNFDETAYSRGGKPWPPSEVASIDGFAPCGYDWMTHCCMIELNQLLGVVAVVYAIC